MTSQIQFNHEHPSATNPLLLPPPSKVVGPVMFDVETDGLHPDDGARVSVISLAFRVEDEDQPVSVAYPFGQGPDPEAKFFDKLPDDGEWRGKHDLGQRAWRHLTRWLNSAGAGLVGHNIKFDILQMNGQAVPGYPGVDLTERVLFDTMVMAAEVWPRGPLALKKIATQLWGLDADEEQRALAPYLGRKTDPRFDLVPWPVMFEYARRDAELTMMVFEQMATELYESTALGRFLPMEMDVNRALIRMEVAGLPYDPEMSRDFARAIDARMEEIQAQLPFNVKPNDIKKFFFSTEPNPSAPDPTRPGLGLEPIETTPTGQPKMTAPIVDRMAAQGVPYTRELREYNRLKSANSKWYYPFADRAGADGRIRTSFRHTGGTKSGRFSASRINLQAVPKDYALQLPVPTPRQVVASAVRDLPADWGLFDLDLEQAELRVAALYAGCEPMLEHIREGRDSHGETATQLFGVSPGDSDWDMYRSIAKRANFSLIFGSGPVSFHEMLSNQAGLDLPMREVRRIVYDWRDLYPEFGRAIETAQETCERFGFVEGLLGRRRYYGRDEDAHSAFNQVVQSSLATYAKMWTLSTDRLCRELDLPARGRRDGVGRGGLLLVVHDSQVLLLPNEEHESIVETICQSASDIWDEAFPGVPGGADWERWA